MSTRTLWINASKTKEIKIFCKTFSLKGKAKMILRAKMINWWSPFWGYSFNQQKDCQSYHTLEAEPDFVQNMHEECRKKNTQTLLLLIQKRVISVSFTEGVRHWLKRWPRMLLLIRVNCLWNTQFLSTIEQPSFPTPPPRASPHQICCVFWSEDDKCS